MQTRDHADTRLLREDHEGNQHTAKKIKTDHEMEHNERDCLPADTVRQSAIKILGHLTTLVDTVEQRLAALEDCANLMSQEDCDVDLEHMNNLGTRLHACRMATQKAFQACTDLLAKTHQAKHSQQNTIWSLRTRIDKGSIRFLSLTVASKLQDNKELRKISALRVLPRHAEVSRLHTP